MEEECWHGRCNDPELPDECNDPGLPDEDADGYLEDGVTPAGCPPRDIVSRRRTGVEEPFIAVLNDYLR